MELPSFLSRIFACALLALAPCCFSQSHSLLLGVHPLDEKYYSSEVINCKDGSKSFSRDRLNDNFCDCADGSDEPGTSACSAGKFYCRNVGSKPEFIFSSHVNDLYCDCCDGSDEYDGNIHCPNICVMGGNSEYGTGNYNSKVIGVNSFAARETRDEVKVEESIHNLTGLKVATILQVVLTIFVVVLWCFHSRTRSRRRRYNSI